MTADALDLYLRGMSRLLDMRYASLPVTSSIVWTGGAICVDCGNVHVATGRDHRGRFLRPGSGR